MTRILLAALLAITLTAPAVAKPDAPAKVDVGAIPAYPVSAKPERHTRAVGVHRAASSRRGQLARETRQASPEPRQAGSGLLRSGKTGATAHVSPRYAAQFQAYIDDLEAGGAAVRFMGGYRKGRCWTGGRHPCGMALDVCQLRRGVVDQRCRLPGPAAIFAIAARHNLFEGGGWRSSDYGHAQAGGNDAVAVRFGGTVVASVRSRGHRHIRLARR